VIAMPLPRCFLPFVFLLFAVAAMAALTAPAACAADYFGKPDTAAGRAADAPRAPPAIALPAPLAHILGFVVAVQSELNARLRAALAAARGGRSWHPVFAIVLLSFLYGVFHAAGPGHGKAVLGSYFLTRRAQLLHGIGASVLSAAVQAVSAIVLVGLLIAVFDLSARRILDHAATLEMLSYGAITLLGLWMAWGIATGRHHCHVPGHDHAHDRAHDHGHDHAHDHGHGHDHSHGHHHAAASVAARGAARGQRWPLLMTSIAVGLRPCSGAILVLLFTLANGMLLTGVAATFAMAFGVAITVSVVTLASLGLQRSAGLVGRRMAALAGRIYRGAALAGALLIALLGALQLVAFWTGLITPMAG
jgi:ABC-type nickel/cobalt efflux system permease component RcnA